MTRRAVRTYGRLRLSGDTWVMSDVEPHVAIRLKRLFPRIASWATDPYEFPHDDATCADLDWFIGRYPVAMSAADRKVLTAGRRKFERVQDEIERILLPDYAAPAYAGLREGEEVRHHQGQAVEVLRRRGALLLGDDVGLGKTYSAIAGMLAIDGALPAAVVVQTHMTKQWKEKIEEFSTLRVHIVKKSSPYNLPEADVYIFKYSILAGWTNIFAQGLFRYVAFDEIQELRTGRSSAKGSAAHILAENAQWRTGLTATPVYNYGIEMYNVMAFLAPGALGSLEEFVREWCGGDMKKVKDPKALGAFLREQHLFLRRTKNDVGQNGDNVNTVLETVPFDEKAVKSAEEVARQLALKATTGEFVERGQALRELDLMMRHVTGVSKAKAVAAYVRIFLENKTPIILAGWHRDVYSTWLKELKEFSPAMYTGTESPAQKEKSKQRFLSGETDLFIMSLRSGAGVDGLQHRCSTVVFGELDWSPGIHRQVIGRVDREGQTEQVLSLFLHSDGGSDPLMIDLLGLKASQAKGIVDPHMGVQNVESDDSRLRLLAQQFLKGRGERLAA